MNRVVITGIGAVTPIGNNADDFWQSLKAGVNGVSLITHFDTSDFKVKVAAEVKNFDPLVYLDKKEVRRMDMFSVFSLYAAAEAVKMSGLDLESIDADRFGVIIGSGIGGLNTMEEQIIKMHDKGPNRVSPLFTPLSITNMAAGNTAIKFGARGYCSCVVTACSAGTHSIGEAYRNIKHGYSDIMLAGGAEKAISKIGIAGFDSLTALSQNEDVNRASIPFDMDRTGFVMGEGAGVLLLESLEHARARGAKIYGEIAGFGANCDAYHMTSPLPDGSGAAKAMTLAIEDANIKPEQVGYINAHGTGTKANDSGETLAIKKVFGKHAENINISSTKSMTGHLLGATGAIEAIACMKALEEGFIPPTINLLHADPECDLNYTPNQGVSREIEYAISNSFGFGGHNGVLCFKKWVE